MSGGANASISLVNSRIFGFEWFDMSLSRKSQIKTNQYKLFLVCILENIPQISIQVGFSITSETFANATVFALIGSLISMFLLIGTFIIQRGDRMNDQLIEIRIKYRNPKDQTRRTQLNYGMRNRICRHLAQNCGFNEKSIFVEYISSFGMTGCKMKFSFLTDLPQRVLIEKLENLTENGSLQLAFKESLDLVDLPGIDYIRQASENEQEDMEFHDSRSMRHFTIAKHKQSSISSNMHVNNNMHLNKLSDVNDVKSNLMNGSNQGGEGMEGVEGEAGQGYATSTAHGIVRSTSNTLNSQQMGNGGDSDAKINAMDVSTPPRKQEDERQNKQFQD